MKRSKVPPEVDNGWAYVVAVAALVCHFMTLGFSMAFSSYYVIFLQVFKEGKGLTAWIGSVNYGMLCGIGPLASLLIRNRGCRVTVFLGGLISTAGIVASSFAQNIFTLVFTFGVISGAGYGLAFTSSIVVITQYFDRYRVLAMGLSLAGGGLGNMVFPWILYPLLELYNWRWALALTGAINLHMCAAALVMRPLTRCFSEQSNIIPQESDLDSNQKQIPYESDAMLNTDRQKKSDEQYVQVQTYERKLQKHQTCSKFIEYLGLKLFNRLPFTLLCINTLLFCFGQSVMFTHIASFAYELGIEVNRRNAVVSSLGVSGLLGRIILGCIALVPRVRVPLFFALCYFLAGVALLALAFMTTFPGLVLCTLLFGTFAAAYGPLLSEVTFIICGPVDFATGYGWVMFFMFLGQIIGAPIAGFLYDFSHYYPGSFLLAGLSLILASLIVLPTVIQDIQKHRVSKSKQ